MKRRSKKIKRTQAPYMLCQSWMHKEECTTYQFEDDREMRIQDLIDILKCIRKDNGVVNMAAQDSGQCGHGNVHTVYVGRQFQGDTGGVRCVILMR